MSLAAPADGWVRITNEDLPGVEDYSTIQAYRTVWYDQGWRSADDPDFTGDPATPTPYSAAQLQRLFDANTILIANTDDTPVAMPVAASRIVGRKATGGIDDLTPAEVRAILSMALNVRDYGAVGDGVTDDTAAFNAAFAAMASTGGTLYIPTGIYMVNNITLPTRQNVKVIGSPSAVLKKNANGPVFTTPAGGWGQFLTFEDVAIDGNGGTYTGVGISVGASSAWFKYINGRITDMASHCVDYSADGAGAQGGMVNTVLHVHNGGSGEGSATVACIKLPNDVASSANRNFVNLQCVGCVMFDDYGSQNSHWSICVARNIDCSHAVSSSYPQKIAMSDTRLASIGAEIAFRGVQNSITGNIFAGDLRITGSASNGSYTGNVIAGAVLADAGTAGNQISGNAASAVTDSGTNISSTVAPTHDIRGARHTDYTKPSGVIAETFRRLEGSTDSNPLTSGKAMLQLIILPVGVVTSISWGGGTVALTRGSNADSHLWYFLADASFNILRSTADDTSGVFSANVMNPRNLSSTYTITTEGIYYLGIMVNMGTGGSPVMPRLAGRDIAAVHQAQLPRATFNENGTGRTTALADATALAFGASQSRLHYATVS